ncbi:MAG: ribosome silencing factor [Candidatus Cloacimonetes bacterium]|nr:ribosome silencing factor [Candidatus Cloacimonadota bacterium]
METITKKLDQMVIDWIEEKKAEHIEVIDVSQKSHYTDCVIVCTAQGELHLNAIAEHVIAEAKKTGKMILGKEGLEGSKWGLIDLGEVVLHIFDEEKRNFYKLEDFLNKELKRDSEDSNK